MSGFKAFAAAAGAILLSGCVTAPAAGASAAPAAPLAAREIVIVLYRGECKGTCPAYSVELLADGLVTFKGEAHVTCMGESSWRIDPAAVRALASRMEAAGFFGFEASYDSGVVDFPYHSVALTHGARAHSVVDNMGLKAGMPPAMLEIEADIDRVAGTDRCVSQT